MLYIDVIQSALTDSKELVRVDASLKVTDEPGLYSLHIDDPNSLPEPWASKLKAANTSLLYIGQASKSLHERLVLQELQHDRPATFFRSIGAVLGFRPATGSLVGKRNQNNYEFTKPDTDAIIQWMQRHLRVSWVVLPQPEIDLAEKQIIGVLRPLLNATHNASRCSDLERVRNECRLIARGTLP